MGSLGNILKGIFGKQKKANDPSNYVVNAGQPTLTTTTQLTEGDAKEAEKADTGDYDAAEKRRRQKAGVAGSFGFTSEGAGGGIADSGSGSGQQGTATSLG